MSLELIPAVDLRGGKAVRLLRGELKDETVYFDDPLEAARLFEAAGARSLHVVDLDGAFQGAVANRDAIERIVRETKLSVEVGGGLRTMDAIAGMIDLGVDRAILGTAAIKDPALLEAATTRFAGKVWVGIDARQGRVAVEGWVESTETEARAFARTVAGQGAAGIIYTDIHRDGASTGPNIDETRRVALEVEIPVVASGGVSSLEDLDALKPLEADGVSGVISGRAIYEKQLDLADGIARLQA